MRVTKRLKRSFVSGMILIAPLVLTLSVLRLLVTSFLQGIDPVVRETRFTRYTANVAVATQLLAVVLTVGSNVLVGSLANRNVGRTVFGQVGRVVNVIPLFSTPYGRVHQVADSLVERSTACESAFGVRE